VNFFLILSFRSFFSLTSVRIGVSDARRFVDDFLIDSVVNRTLRLTVSVLVVIVVAVAAPAIVIVVLVSKKAIIF